MLTIKNLTKSHAGRTLFRETEMTINWGERVALVGPNGAGKSTLFRMILGEDTPDEGSISMDEYAIVGYLPQEASEPKDETVLEIALSITPEMGMGVLCTIRFSILISVCLSCRYVWLCYGSLEPSRSVPLNCQAAGRRAPPCVSRSGVSGSPAARPEAAVPPPPRDCGYKLMPAAAHTTLPAECENA